jgi:hypothetical protein
MQDAVDQGAKLLDQEKPGWAKAVDLRKLDMRSTRTCVLGQVYGAYHTGTDALGLGSGVEEENYGFNLTDIPVDWEQANSYADYEERVKTMYGALRSIWVEHIKDRRAA